MLRHRIRKILDFATFGFGIFVIISCFAGCSVNTSRDYVRYLANNRVTINTNAGNDISCYFLPYTTQNHYYSFTSFMAGYHVTEWEMEIGKVLDATLQRPELRRAFGRLDKTFEPRCKDGNLLVVEIDHFEFSACKAHMGLTFTVKRGDEILMSRRYAASGLKECGKMYWGGGFAMKNAVQQSTKSALDAVLNEFALDYEKAPLERTSPRN